MKVEDTTKRDVASVRILHPTQNHSQNIVTLRRMREPRGIQEDDTFAALLVNITECTKAGSAWFQGVTDTHTTFWNPG
ncbi:hypothetical protein PISMIDRAFT_691017 [Pisolithus microcarpus 441]|uniref:Uncharacterized protein n=1 Tax=Pisolithus microcarpus 441 TaxID=765257 RepID=A0A0C9Y8V6_9AGAM|nr:hypothetical protein PISMIDRAFT_691017 [Pisolithus microcarpus 441]